jgi:hypothetical protein
MVARLLRFRVILWYSGLEPSLSSVSWHDLALPLQKQSRDALLFAVEKILNANLYLRAGKPIKPPAIVEVAMAVIVEALESVRDVIGQFWSGFFRHLSSSSIG